MKGAETLVVLDQFGVRNSHNRPRVSDDNPYSEAFFKTLKYTGRYPQNGFFDIEDARRWFEEFVDHYNHERRHSGINWVQPAVKHAGVDTELQKKRAQTLDAARGKHPERWIGTDIINCDPAGARHLNPEKSIPNRVSSRLQALIRQRTVEYSRYEAPRICRESP